MRILRAPDWQAKLSHGQPFSTDIECAGGHAEQGQPGPLRLVRLRVAELAAVVRTLPALQEQFFSDGRRAPSFAHVDLVRGEPNGGAVTARSMQRHTRKAF